MVISINDKRTSITAYIDDRTKEEWMEWIKKNNFSMTNLIKESVSDYIKNYKFKKSYKDHYIKIKNILTPIRGYIEEAIECCPSGAENTKNYLDNIINDFESLINYLESYYEFSEEKHIPIDYDILYIEDDEATIKMITNHVEDHGYTIKSVDTAEKALNVLKYINPKIILIDIGLNTDEKQGDELCKELRANEKYEEVAIILISAVITPSEVEKVKKETKANDIIRKPFSFKDFDDKITKVLINAKM